MTDTITAAMIVIGDEILSGRTKDKNIGYLAEVLTAIGIDLREVRIVADDEGAIVDAVNALRSQHNYVFTTGGIGPTHDDITADSIAKAFGVPCVFHPDACARLDAHYQSRGLEFTPARQRMARTPEGATLIDNPVSVAPGFIVGNVHVMAGVPAIFQSMMDTVLPHLTRGAVMHSETVPCALPEGVIGVPLGEIQKQHPDTIIGSYPRFEGNNFRVEIVIRSRSARALKAARTDVEEMLDRLGSKE